MRPQRLFFLVLMLFSTSTLFAKIEQWDTFENKGISEYYSRSEIVQIIIARDENMKGRAVNIYVDGEYVTSLLPGAYTEELICPGKHRISMAYTNVLTRYIEKKRGGQHFIFKPKQKYYFRIVNQGKILLLQQLSAKEMEKIEDRYTKKQHHTISRLNERKCIKNKISQAGKGE